MPRCWSVIKLGDLNDSANRILIKSIKYAGIHSFHDRDSTGLMSVKKERREIGGC